MEKEIEVDEIGLFEFFRDYISIKESNGTTRRPNENELRECAELDSLIRKGYKAILVRKRGQTLIRWSK